jgi:hypothetical protein
MTLTAPKIIAGLISTLWAFAALLGPQNAHSEPSSSTIDLAPYLIEPTTTTSSTIVWINPESGPCEQFSGMAVNEGWPIKQRAMLKKVMFRESRCIPTAYNGADPSGGSYGLMQINGFWLKYLSERGIITQLSDLLHPRTNIIAALEIYNYGINRYGYGWNPWSATK